MKVKVNWFGLAGGIATIAVVAISLYVPWWQVSLGEFANAGLSPLKTDISVLGTSLTVPLLGAINIVGLLLLVSSGVVMLVYSILPSESYSKHLLGFAYRKPLYAVVFFVASLLAVSLIVQSIVGIGIPLIGTASIAIPAFFIGGATLSLDVAAGFQWSFWLAVIAAGLCVAARLYHRKAASVPEVKNTAPVTPTEPAMTPSPTPPEAPPASSPALENNVPPSQEA